MLLCPSNDNRLSVLKSVIRGVLNGHYMFQTLNIIAYSNSATQWQVQMVPANQTNLNSAITWINQLRPLRDSNMTSAFHLAGRVGYGADQIYFLTDGDPSSGEEDPLQVALEISNELKAPVNPIAFLAPESAKPVLQKIASRTGGRFNDPDFSKLSEMVRSLEG